MVILDKRHVCQNKNQTDSVWHLEFSLYQMKKIFVPNVCPSLLSTVNFLNIRTSKKFVLITLNLNYVALL